MDRVTARVSSETRRLLERAADICGATLNQFFVQAAVAKAAVAKAAQILERDRVTRLSVRDLGWFLKLLQHA